MGVLAVVFGRKKIREETGLTLWHMWAAGVAFASGNPQLAISILSGPVLAKWAERDVENKGQGVNTRSPVATSKYVYGRAKLGGNLSFTDLTQANNNKFHFTIALTGEPVTNIEDIYINGEKVTVSSSGWVTSPKWLGEDSSYRIRIKKYNGTQQHADGDLVAETSADSTYIGYGIAYLYVRLHYDTDVFSGVPNITAVVQGMKVYDPRTGLTLWSENPALIIRDFIVSEYGLNDSQVDEESFKTAADDCDVMVATAGGGTQKRYTANGVVDSAAPLSQILDDLMLSCNGVLYDVGGIHRLRVGKFRPSTMSLGLGDLRSSIKIRTTKSMNQQYNSVSGQFIDASNNWIETDYPAITSAAFLAQDSGIERNVDLKLLFVDDHRRAQRIAKQKLFLSRNQLTLQAVFGLSAMDIEICDTIDLTVPDYGWNKRLFTVLSWELTTELKDGIAVKLTLAETNAAAFAWDAEEKDIVKKITTLPAWNDVPDIGLSVSSRLDIINQQALGVIDLNISNDKDQIHHYDVDYKHSNKTDWVSLGNGSAKSRQINGVSDGLFDFRARGVNSLGVKGKYFLLYSHPITIFGTPPQNVSDFTASIENGMIVLRWKPVPDKDLSHYKIRHSSKTSGAVYSDATDVAEKTGGIGNSITVPWQTGTYFIKAVDQLGNYSVAASPTVVSVNNGDLSKVNTIITNQESPNFNGLCDNNAHKVTDGSNTYLSLIFSSNNRVTSTTGIYEFFTIPNLNEIHPVRISSILDVSYIQPDKSFDNLSGLFDSLPGLFDGDTTQVDATNVVTQYSITNDNVVWSPWTNFVVTTVKAKHIRFRVLLKTTDDSMSPIVKGLRVTLDMPDRTERVSGITFTGTTNIVYPNGFYAKPDLFTSGSLQNGERYVITNETKSGFTITSWTGTSISTIPSVFNYIAQGHGKAS